MKKHNCRIQNTPIGLIGENTIIYIDDITILNNKCNSHITSLSYPVSRKLDSNKHGLETNSKVNLVNNHITTGIAQVPPIYSQTTEDQHQLETNSTYT